MSVTKLSNHAYLIWKGIYESDMTHIFLQQILMYFFNPGRCTKMKSTFIMEERITTKREQ
jgi:hypothetical protein